MLGTPHVCLQPTKAHANTVCKLEMRGPTSLQRQSQRPRKLLGDCLRRSAYTSPLRLPFFAYLSSSLHASIAWALYSSQMQAYLLYT